MYQKNNSTMWMWPCVWRGALCRRAWTGGKQSQARARTSGTFRSSLEELGYGELEVWRTLKGRRPHLSLHSIDELEKLGRVETQLLFLRERPYGK
jgi:hypothetical protein